MMEFSVTLPDETAGAQDVPDRTEPDQPGVGTASADNAPPVTMPPVAEPPAARPSPMVPALTRTILAEQDVAPDETDEMMPDVIRNRNWTEEQLRLLIGETIRQDPKLVIDSLVKYQQDRLKLARVLTDDQRVAMEDTTNAFVGGNPEGDITIVVFADYNCPHCRAGNAALADLVAVDGRIRLIHRDWPILSEGSLVAAQIAQLATKQGLYREVHDAFMSATTDIDLVTALELAAAAGMDTDTTKASLGDAAGNDHIRQSYELANSAAIEGTPAYIVNGYVVPTNATLEDLKGMIAQLRASPQEQ